MGMYSRLAFLVIITSVVLASCSRPIAQFSYSGKLEAPAIIEFDNQSENADSYEWDFGDGTISTDSIPRHQYKSSGNYLVKLKAKKGNKVKTEEQRLVIDAPLQCLVEVETEFGNMLILLYDSTPKHRDNFSKLVDEGYYEGLLFHRVIDGFMIQGGDPKSKNAKAGQPLGSGGPGYTIPAEFADTLVHVKGALAAARTNNPQKKSSGSQFYIVHGSPVNDRGLDQVEARMSRRYSKASREEYEKNGGTPNLDWNYTVFGRVIKGLEVIDKIATVQTDSNDRPTQDVKMKMRLIK